MRFRRLEDIAYFRVKTAQYLQTILGNLGEPSYQDAIAEATKNGGILVVPTDRPRRRWWRRG